MIINHTLKNSIHTKILILFLLILSVNTCHSLSLNRMILYLTPEKLPRQTVEVLNKEKQTLYLNTKIYEVINPSSPSEKRIHITDIKSLRLITSPNKVIIPPNNRRSIQVISLENPPEVEKVYRITFEPTVGKLQATETAIKILVSYQILVFVRPKNPYYKIKTVQKNNKLVLSNSGNINVLLRNGQYCTGRNNKTCQPLQITQRLYAGRDWELDIPPEATRIRYGLFDGTSEKTKTFKIKKLQKPLPIKTNSPIATNKNKKS